MKKLWLLAAILSLFVAVFLACSHRQANIVFTPPPPTLVDSGRDKKAGHPAPKAPPAAAEEPPAEMLPPPSPAPPSSSSGKDGSGQSATGGGAPSPRPPAARGHRGTVTGVTTTVGDASRESAPSLSEQIQQILDHLPQGQMVFNPPPEMLVGKQERIEARISQDLKQDLVAGLKGSGVPETELIKVSQSMKVTLSGKPYFNIEPLNDEEQLIAAKGFTQWAWDVTPLESGKLPLHLSVRAVIRAPGGGEKARDYPVEDRYILVKITPMIWVQRFLHNYWQWVIGTLLLPALGWLLKKKFGRGGQEPPGNDREDSGGKPRAA